MKKVIVYLALMLLVMTGSSFADPAVGTYFGQLGTAQASGQGHGSFGLGTGLGDDATSFFGTFKYGVSRFGDLGFQLGMVDPDHGFSGVSGLDSKISFGANFSYQIWGVDEPDMKRPFDMAVGGFLQLYPGDDVDMLFIGGFLTGSQAYLVGEKNILTPYARINIRNEKLSATGLSDSNQLKFGLNIGTAWNFGTATTFFGELQIDGNTGFFFGVDFNVM